MKWNNATVVDSEKNVGVHPQVKVGYRVYTEAGEKVDEEGRRYVGWSASLDEWIGSHSLRIQRFGAMTARAEEPGDGIEKAAKAKTSTTATGSYASTAQTDTEKKQDMRDMAMIEEEGQIIYAALRPTCKSAMYVRMINTFGENGGFEDIIRVIESPETGLDHVFYITGILADSQRMYHKSFVDGYLARLSEVVEHKLLNAPEA